jgi:SAM-dependent methyltransferase
MKALPQNLPTFGRFYSWFRNGIAGHLLLCAAQAGVFSRLTRRQNAEKLAAELNLHLGTLRPLLDVFVAFDLLVKIDNEYCNTPQTTSLLADSSYANVLPLLAEVQTGLFVPLQALPQILREGPPARKPEENMYSLPEEVWADSAKGSAAWAFRGAGSQLAGELAALKGANKFSLMLDLGGGHGVFSLYAAAALPALKVRVLDSPAVLEVARQYIEEYSLQGRVSILPGNYLSDPLGEGYDLILASCTLNLTLADQSTSRVVRKIYHALKPGGYFVSLHDAWPDIPESNPLFPVEYPVYSLLSGTPVNMPRGFIASLALECGFQTVRSKELCLNAGMLALDIARKAKDQVSAS